MGTRENTRRLEKRFDNEPNQVIPKKGDISVSDNSRRIILLNTCQGVLSGNSKSDQNYRGPENPRGTSSELRSGIDYRGQNFAMRNIIEQCSAPSEDRLNHQSDLRTV